MPAAAPPLRRARFSVIGRLLDLGAVVGLAVVVGGMAGPVAAQTPLIPTSAPPPLLAVAAVDLDRYVGTWYQVAWFPNRFQRQCVRDTQATYTRRPDGRVGVVNACVRADGRVDRADGLARPVGQVTGNRLAPAQLEVSFLPAALRWTGIGWGSYWVIDLPDDYRYAVVAEPTREYLWVLARAPRLDPADRERIRARVAALGFDLARWEDHPHGATPPIPAAAPAAAASR